MSDVAAGAASGIFPPEDEVLTYFERFSNWGRWGADDEA